MAKGLLTTLNRCWRRISIFRIFDERRREDDESGDVGSRRRMGSQDVHEESGRIVGWRWRWELGATTCMLGHWKLEADGRRKGRNTFASQIEAESA